MYFNPKNTMLLFGKNGILVVRELHVLEICRVFVLIFGHKGLRLQDDTYINESENIFVAEA